MKVVCKRGHRRTPDNVDKHGQCRKCQAFRSRRWNRQNPKKRADAMLRHSYGIDSDKKSKLLKKQKHRCAVCRKPFSNRRKSTKPHVDHKHGDKKQIRGLLCHKCNVFIAFALESVKILRSAIKYLKRRTPCV